MCRDPLTKKEDYATFAETFIQVEVHKLSRGLIKMFQKFNWSEVAILYENITSYIRMKEVVEREFNSNNIKVLMDRELLADQCYNHVKNNRSSFCDPPTSVTNVSDYMGNMFKELKDKCRGMYTVSFALTLSTKFLFTISLQYKVHK